MQLIRSGAGGDRQAGRSQLAAGQQLMAAWLQDNCALGMQHSKCTGKYALEGAGVHALQAGHDRTRLGSLHAGGRCL